MTCVSSHSQDTWLPPPCGEVTQTERVLQVSLRRRRDNTARYIGNGSETHGRPFCPVAGPTVIKGKRRGAPRPVPLGWDGKPTGAVGSTGRSSGCEVSGFRPAARLSLAGEARLVFYARHVCALAAVPAMVDALFTEKVLLLSLIARPLRYFWAIFRRHTTLSILRFCSLKIK